MAGTIEPIQQEGLQLDAVPESLTRGSIVLVATAGPPARDAVCLRLLRATGSPDDTACVVTTTESVEQTCDTYDAVGGESGRPTLGVVDTTSAQQSVSALYSETPVVFTPAPGDLERLVLALSDLSGPTAPTNGARHLVVRSLTPILEAAPTDRVCTILERITGLRSRGGLCLLGIDYTAHDESTMTALADQADGVLWVARSADRLELEYRPTSGRYRRFAASDDAR